MPKDLYAFRISFRYDICENVVCYHGFDENTKWCMCVRGGGVQFCLSAGTLFSLSLLQHVDLIHLLKQAGHNLTSLGNLFPQTGRNIILNTGEFRPRRFSSEHLIRTNYDSTVNI
jgi:hypothetical protein